MRQAPAASRRLSLPSIALLALAGAVLTAQEETAPSPVVVESVRVEAPNPSTEPERRCPGPDTLCKLTVVLANHGDRTASQLGFRVELNGESLVVYDNQLFMYPVQPGETTEIPLYNFWTTETSRPDMPAGGAYEVAVTLHEAQWTDISVDEEGVEVWKPLGPVEGLPVTGSITLETPKP
jgi:hypothetical protein